MSPYFADDSVTLHLGDALTVARTLDAGSVDCIVTSPPYFGLRDYGEPGQYGLEASPAEYVETMRALFAELRRVLADDGTLWLNIGDSYSGAVTASRRSSAISVAASTSASPESPSSALSHAASAPSAREVQSASIGPVSNMKQGARNGNRRSRPRGYEGLGAKNLIGVPWRTALALQDDGWILRNDIIWSKPNAMPESVTDRLSSRHEHLFMLTKKPRYYFNLDAIREPAATSDPADPSYRANGKSTARRKAIAVPPGSNTQGLETSRRDGLTRNPGDVWEIATQPFPGAHFATMPVRLAERCIQAGCEPGGVVLDPFSGSGTTGLAAARHGRRYVGIDLNADYLDLSLRTRLQEPTLNFGEPA